VIFSIDSTYYSGKRISVLPGLGQIASSLKSFGLKHVVVIGHRHYDREPRALDQLQLPNGIGLSRWNEFVAWGARISPPEIDFYRGSFNHPLQIVFSSGTTGKPKAMVHSHGGALLPRKVLNRYNLNLDERDVALQFSTVSKLLSLVLSELLRN
jgi:acetoacetyl-CoA synthetase